MNTSEIWFVSLF